MNSTERFLFILIILILLGAIGYYVYVLNTPTTTPTNSKTSSTPTPPPTTTTTPCTLPGNFQSNYYTNAAQTSITISNLVATGATSYLFAYATSTTGASYVTFQSSNSYSYILTGLTPNTTYSIGITAQNACGSGLTPLSISNISTLPSTTTSTPPPAPACTGPPATISSSSYTTSSTSNSITINNLVSSGATFFKFQSSISGSKPITTTQNVNPSNAYTLSSLVSNSNYTIVVTPSNSCGAGTPTTILASTTS